MDTNLPEHKRDLQNLLYQLYLGCGIGTDIMTPLENKIQVLEGCRADIKKFLAKYPEIKTDAWWWLG